MQTSQKHTPAVRQPFVQKSEGEVIDMIRKLRRKRNMILKWCATGAVAGLIVGFSIPKEYTATAKLAPEITGHTSVPKSLGSIADMMGIGNVEGSADAVYPELYPDIVASVPFAVGLFDVKVRNKKGTEETTVIDYLSTNIRTSWWEKIISIPFQAKAWIVSLFNKDELESKQDGKVDTFCLTREESDVVKSLVKRIHVSVDKKTSVITLSVTMQDPMVSAMLADTVMRNLQRYVTQYRTDKARNDLAFTLRLFDEAQAAYYRAQSKYARYMDANQGIVLRSVLTEQERLQNEMNLAYNVYNQTAQQLQIAKAKVQESTPVYAVVQPVTVPLQPSKPSKAMILAGFVSLAAIIVTVWILFGNDFVLAIRENSEDMQQEV